MAAPLQHILKRSRLLAAECYECLAQCLVVAQVGYARHFSFYSPIFNITSQTCNSVQILQDWHAPASGVALLVRCLYHLFFVNNAASGGVVAATVTSMATITTQQQQQVDQEMQGLRATEAAGRALLVLCSSIER